MYANRGRKSVYFQRFPSATSAEVIQLPYHPGNCCFGLCERIGGGYESASKKFPPLPRMMRPLPERGAIGIRLQTKRLVVSSTSKKSPLLSYFDCRGLSFCLCCFMPLPATVLPRFALPPVCRESSESASPTGRRPESRPGRAASYCADCKTRTSVPAPPRPGD